MPANKNALIRYKTIDNCLRRKYRRWTLPDLVEACSEAIYEAEGIVKGVSVRTVQADIQMMRSDKLGYNAPIEVYDHKYYRYADDDYSITSMPMSQNDREVMQEAVDMLRELQDFDQFAEMADVVSRLQDSLSSAQHSRKPIIHFDSVSRLRGLKLLNPLYNHIAQRHTLRISYQSFKQRHPVDYLVYPYLLKEYRNRWFLFCSKVQGMKLFNLALDRIKGVTVAEDIPYCNNPGFDSEHFFDDVIGVSKDITSRPRRVEFWASCEQSKYIATKPVHSSQQLVSRNSDDGSCIFSIEVVINFEMYSMFLGFGAGVEVLNPPMAVEYMRNQLASALRRYPKPLYDVDP